MKCTVTELQGKKKISCGDDAVARGWCNKHYLRARRSPTGDPGPVGSKPMSKRPRKLRPHPRAIILRAAELFGTRRFSVHHGYGGVFSFEGDVKAWGLPSLRSLVDRGLMRRHSIARYSISAAGHRYLKENP